MTERFDEVLDEARVLGELDAARAEVWVSGLVAEWGDTDALVSLLRSSDRREAVDVLSALAAIEAPPPDAPAHPSGATPPAWARHVGTARAEQAWEITDPFSGNLSIVVEYVHDDDVRHSMLVELEDDLAVDIHFGPPGLVDDAFDESETRSLSVRPLEVDDALGRAAAALAATAAHHDPPVTDEYVMNLPLAAARLVEIGAASPSGPVAPSSGGAPRGAPEGAGTGARPPRDPADAEADAAACATLVAALARTRPVTAEPPDELGVAAAQVRAALAHHDSPDLAALVEDTGVRPDEVDDATLLTALAGAFVVPGRLAAFGPAEREALRSLEWADWLGAVIPLVRDGVGGDASPEQLVRNINRCPEVTTTVPKRDIPVVAAIFAHTLHAWELTGVVDDDVRLTAVGVWVLPRALRRAWGDPTR